MYIGNIYEDVYFVSCFFFSPSIQSFSHSFRCLFIFFFYPSRIISRFLLSLLSFCVLSIFLFLSLLLALSLICPCPFHFSFLTPLSVFTFHLFISFCICCLFHPFPPSLNPFKPQVVRGLPDPWTGCH